MIELYGNKIWNSNTPNKYKKVIIASEDSLDNICQELENSGLNYCAYIFNGEAHIAIGRATANNIDKLDIDYQTVIECNSKVYKTNNIIGTTTYDSIEDKLYRKYNTDFAYKIGQRLTEQGILFSGRIYGKTTTITVDKQYADTLNKISAELKEQRASFMSKSEVVQNESPEESKSVNEKISELHFNESQLSALAPSVKFIQTRNEDNLTDNFVSLFSDCTDFYESQLSALAEIYVDTYRSFSDKSLIFADTSRFNDLKQRFVNDNITAKLTENRGYSTTQFEIIREMVTYGMSESVINLLDYTFSIDEMQNFFTAYKNGSYEDLINLIADIKGTTRTDIEGQIEGGTYTPEIPDYDFLSKNLIFHNPSANHFTVMYFNPDSETGGQFVSTDINYNVAWRGNRDFTNDSERFWRYVEITGNQTLSDVGSKFFRESLNYFYSGEQIAEGLTTDTQKLIADVAPAGNKFKERTRIAEYANLPELMSMFKTIADVRTADTLNLKVPDCELHIVDVEPTELQTELVEELSDRADEVNNGSVDPSTDNMLKITGDGRKLGLDPRLINPSFEDDPGTKLNVCVNNVFDIYEKTSDKKLTQIVFCDLGVPSKNSSADGNKDDDTKSVAELDSLEESGKFCVYDDIRDKLIAKGVSADEIAYIHNAKSETQKSELFAKVRSGEVRILLGSTGKMGTGTNVQDRIIALHDLDVPWRPSDLEQRRGRMVRQGNINDKVHLYRYVTKGTFDAYSYQLLEKKQKFISQIMTSKEPGRKCADVDQAALTYSEIKALCTGDERIREKLTLENRVKELQALKSEYNSTRYELEDKVNAYPEERKKLLLDIGNISKDMETVKNIPFDVKTESYRVGITIGKDAYSLLDDESRKVAAKALTNAVAQVKGDANKNKRIAIGGLGNFGVEVINDGYFLDKITATLRGNYTYSVELGVSSIINLKKIENLLFKVENVLNDKKSELNKLDIDYKTAQNMLHKPFEFEDELNNSTKRLDELTTALNIDMSEHKVDKPKKTHYFGKDFILGKKKSSKQIQNNEVMKSEPKRSEPEL